MTSELRFRDTGWGQHLGAGLEFTKGGARVSLAPAAAPLRLASRSWGVETAGATASQRVVQPLGACGQTTSLRGSTVARATGVARAMAGFQNPAEIVR